MSEEINNIKQALNPAIECINKALQNDRVGKIIAWNKGRHYMLKTHKGLKYWMLYKREFFMSFGKIFDFDGCGDSINKEWVEIAIELGTMAFVFVYKNGYVYIVPPMELKAFAEKNSTIRETKSGETTYSFPVKFLRRWKVR